MIHRSRVAATGVLLALALAAEGCKTAPIPDYGLIAVPSGMPAEQIELAILITMLGTRQQAFDTTDLDMDVDQVVMLLRLAELSSRREFWRLAKREPGRVEGQYVRGGYSIYVEFVYDREWIQPSLIGSVGLKQSDGRIHKNAAVWIDTYLERLPYVLVSFERGE